LDLDPRSISAAVVAADGHLSNVTLGFSTDPQFDRSEAIRLARLALSLDENDERALRRCSSGGSAGEFPTVPLVGPQRFRDFQRQYDLKTDTMQSMTVADLTIRWG
jgi:hypothetical protein